MVDLAAAQPLADVVVGLALQLEVHAPAGERAEALARAAGEAEPHRARRQPRVAVPLGDGARDPRAHREVVVVDRIVARERQAALEVRLELASGSRASSETTPGPVVPRLGAPRARRLRPVAACPRVRRQQHRQVEHLRPRHVGPLDPLRAGRSGR